MANLMKDILQFSAQKNAEAKAAAAAPPPSAEEIAAAAAAAAAEYAANSGAATIKFRANFEAKVSEIMAMPKEAHPPDREKLEEWVAAQASPRRRAAAAALRDNLIYISHGELISHCAGLVDKLYGKPIPAEKKLVWYVGEPSKSAYFMSMICFHFARVRGYRLPDEIVEHIMYAGETNLVVFMFDDMGYTGNQMNGMLTAFYAAAVNKQIPGVGGIDLSNEDNKPRLAAVEHLDLRIGLSCATSAALIRIGNFTFNSAGFQSRLRNGTVPSPFSLFVERTFPSLQDTLGEQLYMDCLMYFNPYAGHTSCICYFDHKIADPGSTFLNVLLFGVVPPSKLNYDALYKYEVHRWKKRTSPFYTQGDEVCDKDIPHTMFIPFIKGCPPYDFAALARLPYEHLMVYWDSDNAATDRAWGDTYIDEGADPATIPPEKNSVKRRCPTSWYKTFFKGGRRNQKTKKRSARKHRSSAKRR